MTELVVCAYCNTSNASFLSRCSKCCKPLPDTILENKRDESLPTRLLFSGPQVLMLQGNEVIDAMPFAEWQQLEGNR